MGDYLAMRSNYCLLDRIQPMFWLIWESWLLLLNCCAWTQTVWSLSPCEAKGCNPQILHPVYALILFWKSRLEVGISVSLWLWHYFQTTVGSAFLFTHNFCPPVYKSRLSQSLFCLVHMQYSLGQPCLLIYEVWYVGPLIWKFSISCSLSVCATLCFPALRHRLQLYCIELQQWFWSCSAGGLRNVCCYIQLEEAAQHSKDFFSCS